MSVKWATRYDYYYPDIELTATGQWYHVAFTWSAGQGITAYLNGCDMDKNKTNGFAYDEERRSVIRHWYAFHFGATGVGEHAAAGTALDEFHAWHGQLSSIQMW